MTDSPGAGRGLFNLEGCSFEDLDRKCWSATARFIHRIIYSLDVMDLQRPLPLTF